MLRMAKTAQATQFSQAKRLSSLRLARGKYERGSSESAPTSWPIFAQFCTALLAHVLNDDDVNMILPAKSGPSV